MNKKPLLSVSVIALLAILINPVNVAAKQFPITDKARSLAQNSIIIDGHIDVPYRVEQSWVDITQATDKGDFDFPRAKAGGLNAPFMSIYIPATLDDSDESTALAHQLIDYVEAIVGRAPDKFAIARSPQEVEQQFAKGLVSLPLGMENGSPIQGKLTNLATFYDRGIRYITLTHAKSNHISDSSYDKTRQWGGLSPFGKEVVIEMNRLGIMVDISHVSDEAFYDVINTTKAPVIASHSSLRTFTPGFERNMDDDMLKALAKNGGIIMINFGSTFLTEKARNWSDTRSDAVQKMQQKYGKDSTEVSAFRKSYREKNAFPYADLSHVVAHIDYAVKLVGIDHVGLGSDYDGVGDSLPVNLKDAASYPNLVQGLINKGYSDDEIRKVLGGNLLRVWRRVDSVAKNRK